ncbi:MAG: protein rep [Alistipes sp.]
MKITNSPLNKAYALTFGCSDILSIDDSGELKSAFFCKKRWCQTCASINMATLINKYHATMEGIDNLNFVTLTVPNCTAAEIPDTLALMASTWRRITDQARKAGMPFRGLRKIELKVGKHYGYHPHYHIIVEDNNSAQWLVTQWLTRLPNCSPKAQDIRPINNIDNALIELMKYATKLTCAESSGNDTLCTPRQMDVIFCNLAKKRLFQPFGGLHGISEDAFEPTPEIYQRARGIYQWLGHDWYHTKYGQALTGWTPDALEISIYQNHKDERKKKQRKEI